MKVAVRFSPKAIVVLCAMRQSRVVSWFKTPKGLVTSPMLILFPRPLDSCPGGVQKGIITTIGSKNTMSRLCRSLSKDSISLRNSDQILDSDPLLANAIDFKSRCFMGLDHVKSHGRPIRFSGMTRSFQGLIEINKPRGKKFMARPAKPFTNKKRIAETRLLPIIIDGIIRLYPKWVESIEISRS